MKILIDTDPALLTLGKDVDDDLAILFLLGSPEIELVGITTTYGNSFSSWTYRDARRLMRACGRTDIPVFRGARGPGAVEATPAARFLAETCAAFPGAVTLLTLGPLTNAARAARLDSAFGRNLRAIVAMGGRKTAGRSELNTRSDPAATNAVFSFPCLKHLVTIEACLPVRLRIRDLRRLRRAPSGTVARFVPRLMRFALRKGGSFHPWDAITAAHLVDPHLFAELRPARFRVDARGRSFVEEPSRGEGSVLLPGAIDVERFHELFEERVRRP
jgi:inosine-uridine nucleoside N-ribohydrolase